MNEPGSRNAFSLAYERLGPEDERYSLELAIRCGLKSARGDAPKPAPHRPGRPESVPLPNLTREGLRWRMAKARARIKADPSDLASQATLRRLNGEWERRIKGG